MITYIEGLLQPTSIQISGTAVAFIKVEVTSTEQAAKNQVENQMTPGRVYVMRRHSCHHDEKIFKPCVTEVITSGTN